MRFFSIVIFIFLNTSLIANEHRLLLSGLSLHEIPHNLKGEPYNSFSSGVGYEYNLFEKYNEVYFGFNTLVLNDSFYNPQATLGSAIAMRFHNDYFDTSIAFAGFVGYKKLYQEDENGVVDEGSYRVIGGALPTLTLYYKEVNVNLMYFPSFEYKTVDMTGYMYINFGWKFSN